MSSRFYRSPEETRLTLEGGEWLLVKKHLTAGESRAAQAKLFRTGSKKVGEALEVDLEQLGVAEAVAYLIDWSITDVEGKPIRIRDQPYEFVAAALNAMDTEPMAEILKAISTHAETMARERESEKKTTGGSTAPSPISTSAE